MRTLLLSLVSVIAIGCAGGASEAEYTRTLSETANEFARIMSESVARPLPSKEGLTKDQRHSVLANFIRQDAAPLRKLAKRLEDLHEP